jgi:monofunctional chorismate mutase
MSAGVGIAAVRGAIQVPENTAPQILASTVRLLRAIMERNALQPARVISALFTTTADLDADFPAHAARTLGWTDVPMLNAREIPVPGALPRVVRVLLTVSGTAPGARLAPVYLDGAELLRPDLAPTTPPRAPDARTVAIIGMGQIGGSVAQALRVHAHWRRVGFDTDAAVLARALAAGALDEAAESLAAACAHADIAVIATPADVLPATIDAAAAALPAGAALLDTGSARVAVRPALARAAARGILAVGAHPLAGTEGHGFAAARASLFADATIVLSPVAGDVPAIVLDLVRDLGARPLVLEAEAHDHALARTSHLPYLVACGLREIGAAAAAAGLSGPGFRDMTRLAASDPRMAGAYCEANAAEVATAWRELRDAVEARVAALGASPGEGERSQETPRRS